MGAQPRGFITRVIDLFYARSRSLPPETCSYTVETCRIPVDEEIKIKAYVYQPTSKALGTILVRSPYGIDFPNDLFLARVFAARGYVVLLSSCRGTAGSDGDFVPGLYEAVDGNATLAWMRQQSWYTDSFATVGGSYLGFVQWALLSNPPPDMKAAVINTGPTHFGHFTWPNGGMRSDLVAWADFQGRVLRNDNLFKLLWHLRGQQATLKPVYDSVPLADGLRRHFNDEVPVWLTQMLSDSDVDSEFWKGRNHVGAVGKAEIPILLTTGWEDLVFATVMETYSELHKRGCTVALSVGPHTHLHCGSPDYTLETIAWFDRYLAGSAQTERVPLPPNVRVYVTGQEKWREFSAWPPATNGIEFFLSERNSLLRNVPESSGEIATSSFVFDPVDPTPSVSAPSLFDNAPLRSTGDKTLTSRKDVANFVSEPLEDELEVYGTPVVELYHSTDSPFADLFVFISDIDTKGFSHTRSELYLRLTDEKAVKRLPSENGGPERLRLVLSDCAHHFKKGHRIGVCVAGGSHPRFIRNLGTGEDPMTGTNMKTVTHTIQHSDTAISKLILPVIKEDI